MGHNLSIHRYSKVNCPIHPPECNHPPSEVQVYPSRETTENIYVSRSINCSKCIGGQTAAIGGVIGQYRSGGPGGYFQAHYPTPIERSQHKKVASSSATIVR